MAKCSDAGGIASKFTDMLIHPFQGHPLILQAIVALQIVRDQKSKWPHSIIVRHNNDIKLMDNTGAVIETMAVTITDQVSTYQEI